jgi:hypothetical protein
MRRAIQIRVSSWKSNNAPRKAVPLVAEAFDSSFQGSEHGSFALSVNEMLGMQIAMLFRGLRPGFWHRIPGQSSCQISIRMHSIRMRSRHAWMLRRAKSATAHWEGWNSRPAHHAHSSMSPKNAMISIY